MQEMKRLPDSAHPLVVSGFADECWQNSLYEVLVRRDIKPGDKYGPVTEAEFPEITWLSIKLLKKHGKGTARDWRHFQEIKNDICGVESEGVELFPAESRKVDGSNQYHMWVLNDPFGWPFGMAHRMVLGCDAVKKMGTGAVQRPIHESDRYCDDDPTEAELGKLNTENSGVDPSADPDREDKGCVDGVGNERTCIVDSKGETANDADE